MLRNCPVPSFRSYYLNITGLPRWLVVRHKACRFDPWLRTTITHATVKTRPQVMSRFINDYAPSGASQVAPVVKNPSTNAGDIRDMGSIPGSGRSPGGGHGSPL